MSTIVITPTHIACDHMVVSQTLPHTSYVDTNHMKIFVDPEKRFIFAITGNYDPKDMQSEETYSFIHSLLVAASKLRSESADKNYLLIKDETLVKQLTTKLPKDMELFVTTLTERYAFLYMEKYKCIALQTIGEMHGVGTGGPYAVGMLRAGMSISDIWEPLNRLVDTSSVAHTIIPLSILEKAAS